MSRAKAPLRILMSAHAYAAIGADVDALLGADRWMHVLPSPGSDFDIAFVSRDVTGLSTKHTILPDTRAFYDAMLGAASLRWVHIHSAGTDRQVFITLAERGVPITNSSGVNATIVAHGAVAGILAIARHLPKMMEAQREHRWTSLMASGLPHDLEGQHAAIVGWGPVGQGIARLLRAFGLAISVARRSGSPAGEGIATVGYHALGDLLPDADWLVLCCPLSDETRKLVDARLLARLPARACIANVARGEVIEEAAMIDALANGRLGGAYLDVFEHEPLAKESPLWDMPNVIVTPHSAGLSDGNETRVMRLFLEKLAAYVAAR